MGDACLGQHYYPYEKPTIGHFSSLGGIMLFTVACLAFWKRSGRLEKIQLFGAFRLLKSRVAKEKQMRVELGKARQKYALAGNMTGLLSWAILSVLAIVVDLMIFSSDKHWHSGPWYVSWSIMGLLMLLLVRLPVLHNLKGVPVSYMAGVLMMCVYVNRVNITKQDFLFSQPVMTTILICISPVGGLKWSTLGAILYSTVASYSFITAQGESEIKNTDYVTGVLSMGLGSLLMGSYCMIGIMWNSVHSIVERKAALAEREAVSSLLVLVCDAVVELDELGRIVSPSLDLSNLLLLERNRSTAGVLQDRKLQDLLYTDAEKERFESFMGDQDPSKSAVGHFDMRDSCSAPVRMEIFKVVLSSSGASSVKYLIGIKEHSDFDRVTNRADPPSMIGELSQKRQPEFAVPALSGQSSDSEKSEDIDGDSGRLQKRFTEGNMPTCQKAVDVSLLLLMDSWRCFTLVGRACCSFHAAHAKLAAASARLKRMRCDVISKSTDTFQCSQCGIEESPSSPFCFMTEVSIPGDEPGGSDTAEVQCSVCEGIEQFFPKLKEGSKLKEGGWANSKGARGPNASTGVLMGSAASRSSKGSDEGSQKRGRRAAESGQGTAADAGTAPSPRRVSI